MLSGAYRTKSPAKAGLFSFTRWFGAGPCAARPGEGVPAGSTKRPRRRGRAAPGGQTGRRPACRRFAASFGGSDAYPGLIEQAAGRITHLAQNHPLPDGNKRVSFLLMVRFLGANGAAWGEPDIDDDAGTVERIAASRQSPRELREPPQGRPPWPHPLRG
ncbi:Fic family protein [Conexibacter stalactiti]|uniref:Fic family protein n=1 Tax=Conexibacter stalactiti TaxID=1940611 RepID=A0ABU4HK70_9ACTN|nr:Fic family protein [Conexibacter stalactiti]MDW5593702.1 Fic family protein [Conexibacter stalactiti]MEC5034343.1 Fic family protein [Conexibacter stalactiti]